MWAAWLYVQVGGDLLAKLVWPVWAKAISSKRRVSKFGNLQGTMEKAKKKRGGVAPNKTNKKVFEKVFILLGAILGAIWSIMGPKYFKYFPMAKIFEPLPALLISSTIV